MKLFIGLLLAGTTSLSLYLLPSPIERRSPLHFLQFFALIAVAVAGIIMMIPFLFDWRLPLQQGLGSNQELLWRGLLILAASVFALIARRLRSDEKLLWLSALALLAVGLPEVLRVLDILNLTVNGILEYTSGSMTWMLAMMSPYLFLLVIDSLIIFLGTLFLLIEIVKLFCARPRRKRA